MADAQYEAGIPFGSPGYEIKTQEELEAYVRSIEKARIAMWQSIAAGKSTSDGPATDAGPVLSKGRSRGR